MSNHVTDSPESSGNLLSNDSEIRLKNRLHKTSETTEILWKLFWKREKTYDCFSMEAISLLSD